MTFKHLSWVSILWIGILVWFGMLVFLGSHAENQWTKLGVLVLIAPIPLFFTCLFILAYGEWLFSEIQVYRLDKSLWMQNWLERLQKLLLTAVVLGSLGLLVWILEDGQLPLFRPSDVWWLVKNLLKAGLLLALFSGLSLAAYSFYLRYRRKRLYQNLKEIYLKIKNQ